VQDRDDTKAVGIWIRVSTEDQARGESPEHHEHRARMYAEAKGWEVREVYRLEAVSGKSVMDRPETKRMLEHVRTGRITGLIFSKLARLAGTLGSSWTSPTTSRNTTPTSSPSRRPSTPPPRWAASSTP